MWDIILQIGFWISPIAYPIEIIPAKYLNIYMLNPLANLITISRGVVLDNKFPNPKMMLTSFITLLIILMLGYAIYKNTVRFISSDKEQYGFLIESQEFAEMMRGQFEIIWNASKPFNPKK